MRKTVLCAAGVVAAMALSIGAIAVAQAGTLTGTETTKAADAADADAAKAAAAAADLTGDITFSVPSGTFQGTLSVALSTSVSGAEIRYTTNGQLPSASSPRYSSAQSLTATTQLRAQAFVGGAASGAPGTALYVARSINATHDLPVLVMDDYGKGKPAREYVDASMMLFEPTGGSTSLAATPTIATRSGFHLRGQSTAMFDKAPYRLELHDNADDDADYPVLGMPADSDWVLRGPFSDKTLIHDAFMLGLGSAMGRSTPRFAFCEFYLNLDAQPLSSNDYQGVYLIMETIKNSKDRLDLKQLEEDDTTLPAISGGYIFKFEWLAAEEPTLPCTGTASTCWSYLEVADPDPLNAEQKAWLTQHLQQFHNLLHSSQYADPTTGYSAWIDVGSFIDQIIVNELSRDMDAYVRSVYFHKDRDAKIVAGPMWDYDLTFGTGGYFSNNQTTGWQYEQKRNPSNPTDWFTILLKDPTFVAQLKARWQQLRQGVLSNAQISSRFATLTTPLANAAQRNFQRWPNLTTQMIGPFITQTASTWQGQVQQMQTWMNQRIAWLDSATAWGGAGQAIPSASAGPSSPVGSASSSATASPTASTTPPVTGQGCTATYAITSQWTGGFQADVKVTAGASAITGWKVTWTYADGQTIGQAWNATVTTSGTTVTAANAAYNGALAAGAGTSFGFTGSWNGANSAPAVTCTAS